MRPTVLKLVWIRGNLRPHRFTAPRLRISPFVFRSEFICYPRLRSGPCCFPYHLRVLQLFERNQRYSEKMRHKPQQPAKLFKDVDQWLKFVLDLCNASVQLLELAVILCIFIELFSKSRNGCTICHYLHRCGCAGETSYLILNRNDPIGWTMNISVLCSKH